MASTPLMPGSWRSISTMSGRSLRRQRSLLHPSPLRQRPRGLVHARESRSRPSRTTRWSSTSRRRVRNVLPDRPDMTGRGERELRRHLDPFSRCRLDRAPAACTAGALPHAYQPVVSRAAGLCSPRGRSLVHCRSREGSGCSRQNRFPFPLARRRRVGPRWRRPRGRCGALALRIRWAGSWDARHLQDERDLSGGQPVAGLAQRGDEIAPVERPRTQIKDRLPGLGHGVFDLTSNPLKVREEAAMTDRARRRRPRPLAARFRRDFGAACRGSRG